MTAKNSPSYPPSPPRSNRVTLRESEVISVSARSAAWAQRAAIEAVSKNHGGDPIKEHYRRVAERRGKNKGRVAAARKVLTLFY